MRPQHWRIGEITLARRDAVAGVADRDVVQRHSPHLDTPHQQPASFETHPGFAVTLLRMRYIMMAIKNYLTLRSPRTGRLEGRMLPIRSRDHELQEHAST
jgi:hypothetical protein